MDVGVSVKGAQLRVRFHTLLSFQTHMFTLRQPFISVSQAFSFHPPLSAVANRHEKCFTAMPVIGYNCDSGAVVEVVNPASGALGFAGKTVIPGGIVSAASAGDGVLYYLPMSSPSMLHRRNLESGADEIVESLARAHTQVFFHRNKVMCISAGSTEVVVYDPLCSVTEIISLPYRLVRAEPADHGFAFLSDCNRVFGYDFNNGLTEVIGGGSITSFLGHYKQYAVALLHDGKERVVGVTEAGSIVELDAALPRVPFTSLDDVVLHTSNNEVVSSKGGSAASPVGEVHLSSSQPTDSEVLCTVCMCEFDGEDGITLDCGHYFHKECIEQWVGNWMDFAAKGEHVKFTRAVCPGGCKHLVRHPMLAQSKQISDLYTEVTAKKAEQLKHFDATKAEHEFLFYLCGRCGGAFYGGDQVCSRMQGHEPSSSPQELICDTCLRKDHRTCDTLTAVFKCRYCCNPATQRSFGTRFMCDRCIARWDTAEPALIPCPGADSCPFHGNHPEPACDIAACLTCLDPAMVSHIFDRVAGAADGAGGGTD
ncbi:Zinc finger, C3HC4 type (RING finger)/Ring finger domain containing protein, putative [Leishmania donovani]|uniref:Zinc finger, C3HC4 type (RING finger)/Ring finger domain containing protein, putative n=1 Tax=Leishmania donovani TaxID=5661 RepID=A0A3Q8ICQ4_LEIDO|nr:Zinc finger, C3HC4 type (RING finger)/Ring finger domain containing protein, putative [Leishmania donovani]